MHANIKRRKSQLFYPYKTVVAVAVYSTRNLSPGVNHIYKKNAATSEHRY